MGAYHAHESPGRGETYLKELPSVLSGIIDLNEICQFLLGVDASSHHYLVLVDWVQGGVHFVEQERSDHLPFLNNNVIASAGFNRLSCLGVLTSNEVDEALVVAYRLSPNMFHLVKTWFLEQDIVLVVKVINLGSINEEDRVVARVRKDLALLDVDWADSRDIDWSDEGLVNTATQNIIFLDSDLFSSPPKENHSWPFNIVVISQIKFNFKFFHLVSESFDFLFQLDC